MDIFGEARQSQSPFGCAILRCSKRRFRNVSQGLKTMNFDGTQADGVALIWGDGGIKGGFVAAVADETMHMLKDMHVPIKAMMASSASVGNMLYFLSAGYDHPGLEMWTQVLSTKRFLKYHGMSSLYENDPIYDIDYLVDDIFKIQFPLDLEKIRSSPITIFFPVEDADTGELVYFSNRPNMILYRNGIKIEIQDMFRYDIYKLIKAASAAPFVYDRPVFLGNRRFIDAAASEPFAFDLPLISTLPKIIVLTKAKPGINDIIKYFFVTMSWLFFVYPFKKNRYRIGAYIDYALKPLRSIKKYREIELMEQLGSAVSIVPLKRLGSNYDNSRETLCRNYDSGRDAARYAVKRIRAMLRPHEAARDNIK